MAERRRNTDNARRYRTYGSVAYQPEYDQEPARAPSRREQMRGSTVRRPEGTSGGAGSSCRHDVSKPTHTENTKIKPEKIKGNLINT